jgi:hypothetical protein
MEKVMTETTRENKLRQQISRCIVDVYPDVLYCRWDIGFIDDDYTNTPQKKSITYQCMFKKSDDGLNYVASYEIFPRKNWFKSLMNLSYNGAFSSISFNLFQNGEEYTARICTVEPVTKDEFSEYSTIQRQITDKVYDIFETDAYTETFEGSEVYKFHYKIIEEKHVKYLCGFSVEIPTTIFQKYLINFFGSIEQNLRYTFK